MICRSSLISGGQRKRLAIALELVNIIVKLFKLIDNQCWLHQWCFCCCSLCIIFYYSIDGCYWLSLGLTLTITVQKHPHFVCRVIILPRSTNFVFTKFILSPIIMSTGGCGIPSSVVAATIILLQLKGCWDISGAYLSMSGPPTHQHSAWKASE